MVNAEKGKVKAKKDPSIFRRPSTPGYDSDEPSVPVSQAASSSSKKMELKTAGDLSCSGPLTLISSTPELLNVEDSLLQSDKDKGNASFSDAILSASEWDEQLGQLSTIFEEEVITSSDDSRINHEPMETSDGEERVVDSKARDPSLPPEDADEDVQITLVKPPLRKEIQTNNATGLIPVMLPLQAVQALMSLPVLMKNLPQSSPLDKQRFVTFQDLQSILNNRAPLRGPAEQQEFLDAPAILKKLESIDEKFSRLQQQQKEATNASRGCSGKLDAINETMKNEAAANAAVVKEAHSLIASLKGCVSSMQFYIARKTEELEFKGKVQDGSSDGPTSSTASARSQSIMANIGTMLGSAQSYERKHEMKRVEKAADMKPKEKDPCVYCNSTVHSRHRCTTYRDAESRRHLLIEQKRCFLCFSAACDTSEGRCPVTRNRLCSKCFKQPAKFRVHDASLCTMPDQISTIPHASDALSTASHGSYESSDTKAKKRNQDSLNDKVGCDNAKRSRVEQFVKTAPLADTQSATVVETSMKSGINEPPVQVPKKKKKRSKSKKQNRKDGETASQA
ncbi:unnamed protein product [Caenorhabditis brenneri]